MLSLVALLCMLALLAAACGGDDDGSEEAGEDDDGDEEAAATDDGGEDDDAGDGGGNGDDGDSGDGDGVDEEVELTAWFAREYYVPPDVEEGFGSEHPNISLSVDVQPADDLFQQLIRMQDAGQELPDLVHLDGFLRPAVARAGVVVPIQDVVDRWAEEAPEQYEQIADVVWEQAMYEGELVGMANTASMEEIYYRLDWLSEAGMEGPPESWDDVLDMARAIQEQQPDATPLGWWATRGSGANHVYATMTAMGVEFDGSVPQLQSGGSTGSSSSRRWRPRSCCTRRRSAGATTRCAAASSAGTSG